MEEVTVKIRYISKPDSEPHLPQYLTAGSAGADLHAYIDKEWVIKPGESKSVPTGICIELPGPHIVALVFGRSGLAAKASVSLTNAVGVIDSDYRGEIKILLINHGHEDYTVCPGDRIAQILFMPVYKGNFVFANQLSESQRGEGGFGSTGSR